MIICPLIGKSVYVIMLLLGCLATRGDGLPRGGGSWALGRQRVGRMGPARDVQLATGLVRLISLRALIRDGLPATEQRVTKPDMTSAPRSLRGNARASAHVVALA